MPVEGSNCRHIGSKRGGARMDLSLGHFNMVYGGTGAEP